MRTGLFLAAAVALAAPAAAPAADPPITFQAQPAGRMLNDARVIAKMIGGDAAVKDMEKGLKEAFGEKGFWERLPTLQAPALFIWGRRDRLVPFGFARHVAEALPNSETVVFPDCGHVPQFELPDQTHAHVREFLARVEREGRISTTRPALVSCQVKMIR